MGSSPGALWTVDPRGDPRKSLPQDRKAEIEDEEAAGFSSGQLCINLYCF